MMKRLAVKVHAVAKWRRKMSVRVAKQKAEEKELLLEKMKKESTNEEQSKDTVEPNHTN
jgi:hypothetical protein